MAITLHRQRLNEKWNELRRQILPPDAPAKDIHTCRDLFFDGALAAFTILTKEFGPLSESEINQGIAEMDRELTAHVRRAERRLR